MKLRLEFEVEYSPNGVKRETLAELLSAIADRAAGEGLMTGETEAEVEEWFTTVKDVDTGEIL